MANGFFTLRALRKFEIQIPFSFIQHGIDVSTTGIKYETKQIILSDEIVNAKEIYFESNLNELVAGAKVRLELYDYTKSELITYLEFSTSSKRLRSSNIKSLLINRRNNSVGIRLNVITATTGTAGGALPVLILKY